MTSPSKPTDPTFTRVREVLCEVAELPYDQQVAVAQERLHDQPETLARVLGMLARAANVPDFLEPEWPSVVGASPSARFKEFQAPAGSNFAHFEIKEKIGQGGMAVVFRARQFEPVEREVALKVISSYATDAQKERFQRECQMLARFSHPNIATMYESGVNAGGELYVAMELVEGPDISRWCHEHHATVEQRIGLVIDACNAVAHAHGRGVLHRDLKPSNILVTTKGGKPLVKVIDFGIASALNPGLDALSTLTGQHILGTPAYMSPEAVRVTNRDHLDARSDDYALAVVLFELLCGTVPYRLANLPVAQWMKTLSEHEAPRLSAAFSSLTAEEQARIAEQAHSSISTLKRYLSSDIELIVRKALSLEPSHRYETSRDLSEDLRRFLKGKPVLAHPPSRIYQVNKYLRRHWLGAGATLLLLLSLLGGVVANQMKARETRLALEESEAVSGFLVNLLEHASPLRTSGDDVVLKDIIDHGAEQLEEQFNDHPAVRSRLLHTLGRVYGEQGDYERGAELMEQARQVSLRLGLDDSSEFLQLLSDLGVAQRRQGHLDEAESILTDALDRAHGFVDDQPLLVADIANSLGNVYVIREDFDNAERQHARALALREANLPEGHLDITSSRNNLTAVYINSWQQEKALPYAQQVLKDWQQSLPPDHPWLGIARGNLAIVLDRLGKSEEALEQLELARDEAETRLGPDHPDMADYWRNLGAQYLTIGDYGKFREAFDKHVAILSAALGPDAPRTLSAEMRSTVSLEFPGRDYSALLQRLDSIRRRLLRGEPDEALLLRIDALRIRCLIGLGRTSEARNLLESQRQALLFSPSERTTITYTRMEGALLAAEGRIDDSITMLEALAQQVQTSFPPPSVTYTRVALELARSLAMKGNLAAAIDWTRRVDASARRVSQRVESAEASVQQGIYCLEMEDTPCAREAFAQAASDVATFYPEDHYLNREIRRGFRQIEALNQNP